MHQKREKRPTRSEEHGGKQAIIAKSDKGKPLPLVLVFNSSFNFKSRLA